MPEAGAVVPRLLRGQVLSEATIAGYKKDLRFFTELRIQARRDAMETVDYSRLRGADTQAGRQAGHRRTDQGGRRRHRCRSGLARQDHRDGNWSEEKTRNETDIIRTRLKKTIEQDLADDPYAQTVFSELLRQAIAEAEALFDHPLKQYVLFKDLEERAKARATPDVPDRFGDNDHAKAYFGLFPLVLGEAVREERGEEWLIAEALHIDAVAAEAVADALDQSRQHRSRDQEEAAAALLQGTGRAGHGDRRWSDRDRRDRRAWGSSRGTL